jgi:hypothetical protein
MAKKKKKRTAIPLTASSKMHCIVCQLLDYAEVGGMKPKHCGIVYESIVRCLLAVGDDPDIALSGLISQIGKIVHAKECEV